MELLTEPSKPQLDNEPTVPQMDLRQIEATWNMLVEFKQAIRETQWSGNKVQAVAMGLQMIVQMEQQSRGQLEAARRMEKETSGK